MIYLIQGWRAETALTPGYYLSRLRREEGPPANAGGSDKSPYGRATALRELTINYIAMCELGSLQSDWPVEPPSARTCAV